MCWEVKPQQFKLQITQEDIPVYKVIRHKGGHIYSWNTLYCYDDTFALTQYSRISFEEGDDGYICGYEGFHAYEIMPQFFDSGILAGTIYREKFNGSPLVVKCYIPKGALYATNGKETISSEIKFDKLISAETLVICPGTGDRSEVYKRYEKAYKQAKGIIDTIKNE